MGDTPRTDEFARAECCDLEHALEFARELERELEQERQLADRLASDVSALRSILADLGAVGTMGDASLAAWKTARNEAVNPP